MEKTIKKLMLCSAMAAGVAVVGPSLKAQESEGSAVAVEASVDIAAKYVWRGLLLTDDPVVQPSVTLSVGGLSLNIWGSIDTTDINEAGGENYRLQEVDYTLSYGFSVSEKLGMAVGIIHYDFPGTVFDSTREVFVSAGLDTFLSPSLAVYYDIDESDGLYINASVSHSVDLTERLALGLSAAVGWGDDKNNAFYFGPDKSGLADLALSASLDYAVSANLAMSFYLRYTEIIDSDLENAVRDSDVFNGGVNFTYSF